MSKKQDKYPKLCTWVEACEAVDFALEHFGRPKDRGIWVWYCRRIGLERFLDLVYGIISMHNHSQIYDCVRALQKQLQETLPPREHDRESNESAK